MHAAVVVATVAVVAVVAVVPFAWRMSHVEAQNLAARRKAFRVLLWQFLVHLQHITKKKRKEEAREKKQTSQEQKKKNKDKATSKQHTKFQLLFRLAHKLANSHSSSFHVTQTSTHRPATHLGPLS